ncbi:MAG: RnfABCDGE type electron transport complex subunit D, partial [Oscillospiraceae bacterium]|nr:RnfABCDGE type electron transport complex subunit D [Oscillospiraceae bacterium]
MTDYKALKLKASSSPHIRSSEDTHSIMLDVIIAMVPALAFAVFNFGLRALSVTLVSVLGCLAFEWLYRKLLKKHNTVGDLSAVVTGMLLAFVCPVTIPYWMILVGDFFAIVVVKQLYGGLGKNFLNPALAGRAALVACYAGAMTQWVEPMTSVPMFGKIDAVTAATPLAVMKEGDFAAVTDAFSLTDMFLGKVGGSLGEVSALMLLLGGVYLMVRKVITFHIPVAYIGTVAVLTFLFPRGNDPMEWMLYNLTAGGLMLGAIFMATDYATSPVTHKGQVIFGIGCGLLTVFIRYFGSYPEGVCYSILVMNCVAWLIDKYVKPA